MDLSASDVATNFLKHIITEYIEAIWQTLAEISFENRFLGLLETKWELILCSWK